MHDHSTSPPLVPSLALQVLPHKADGDAGQVFHALTTSPIPAVTHGGKEGKGKDGRGGGSNI